MPASFESSRTPAMDGSTTTRSPVCHSATAPPTAATTPAMSMPAMWGKAKPGMWYQPWRCSTSRRFRAAAATSTTTSPAPGTGSGTSVCSNTSGPPVRW